MGHEWSLVMKARFCKVTLLYALLSEGEIQEHFRDGLLKSWTSLGPASQMKLSALDQDKECGTAPEAVKIVHKVLQDAARYAAAKDSLSWKSVWH